MFSEKLSYGLMGLVLTPVERILSFGAVNAKEPVIFIIGLPRCGSTLLQQLIGQKTDIAFVTNLHAKFWRAPSVGALVSKVFKPSVPFTEYNSVYGITPGLWGPNEWGWFWRDTIPKAGVHKANNRWIARLRRKLSALERVQRKPMIFDNVDLFPFITKLADGIQNAIFIYLHRDPLYVANSVINASIKRYGMDKKWYGPVPKSVEHLINLPIDQRVVIQVRELDHLIKRQVDAIEPTRILHVDYDKMCMEPDLTIEKFVSFVEKHGGTLEVRSTKIPRQFLSRNKPKYLNQEFRDVLLDKFNNNFTS